MDKFLDQNENNLIVCESLFFFLNIDAFCLIAYTVKHLYLHNKDIDTLFSNMFSSNPFYSQSNQPNNYNSLSHHAISNSNQNLNPMTVSGTLRTSAKPLQNNMCSGRANCSSHH
jgi:hypothetical protein